MALAVGATGLGTVIVIDLLVHGFAGSITVYVVVTCGVATTDAVLVALNPELGLH